MTPAYQLLVIDPQNDFCDLPDDWCPQLPLAPRQHPSLPVAGAHADMLRVAAWLRTFTQHVDMVTVTLDSHQRFDIAHPDFWQQGYSGSTVAPFTPITAAQVRQGQYLPRVPTNLDRALKYLDALEAAGRYTLMVWPVHCEIGSWGHGIHPAILAACGQWQVQRQQAVHHIHKGTNPWTEHYSCLRAEVSVPDDPSTQLNTRMLERLQMAEHLIIAGEASSHCVRTTVEDLLSLVPPEFASRITLLTDGMSPVPGFEAEHEEFFTRMQAQGVQLSTTTALVL